MPDDTQNNQPPKDTSTDTGSGIDTTTQDQQPDNSQVSSYESEPPTKWSDPAASDDAVASSQAGAVAGGSGAKPRNRKKALIVAAAVIVAGLGGSVAAYNLWYQNPDKVLVDSVINMAKADTVKMGGSFKWQNDDIAVNMTPDFVAQDANGIFKAKVAIESKSENTKVLDGATVDANIAYEKDGTFYFKLDGLKGIYDSAIDTLIDQQAASYRSMAGRAMTDAEKERARTTIDSMYGTIVDKLDGQWIKADTESNSENAKRQKCLATAYKKFEDRAVVNEVSDAFKEHRFITVKERLGSKDGNLGYKLDLNQDTARDFLKSFRETSIGKELLKCDEDSLKLDDSSNDDLKDASLEVWVSRWSHELARVKFSGQNEKAESGSFNGDITTSFNEPVEVSLPKDAKTLEEVLGEGGLFGSMLGAGSRTNEI